jgi:aspartate/methionine/tyrosine aminotransferase
MRSRRLPGSLLPNAVSRAVAARRGAGHAILDLTVSNPTTVGLPYPPDLLAPLGDGASLAYEPHPLGLWPARVAVAGEIARQGTFVPPDRVTLTASTSEAYALLFKLLCDPGDAVLAPRPSYPLVEHLARLEGIDALPYDLEYHGTWRVDMASLGARLDSRVRAIVVVSPNNPTGSWLHADDLAGVTEVCRDRGLVLIGDEVFADYPLDAATDPRSVLQQSDVVACSLGGLSKSVGLPQVKLAWIAWRGPESAVGRLIHAYEIMADSYLSVGTPVQVAAPVLLARGAAVRTAIHARVRRNLDWLKDACGAFPDVTVLGVEGGWSAVLRVPATHSEEETVVRLVNDTGVLMHPGYFFDFRHEAFLVTSLLVEPDVFDHALDRALSLVSRHRR